MVAAAFAADAAAVPVGAAGEAAAGEAVLLELLLLLLMLLHPTRDRCVRCAVQLPRQQHTHALHSGYSCALKNRRRSSTSPHRGYELPLEYRPLFNVMSCVRAPDCVRVYVAKGGLKVVGEKS